MRHKNSGLTLTEIMIAVTVLSLLVLSLYTVFRSAMDAWSKADTRIDILQNARVILDQMSRELPGTFVGDGATFVGTNGSDGDPDSIEFATVFRDSIYQIKYWIDSSVFKREYAENPDFSGGYTYTPIEFSEIVSDFQLLYWETGVTTDWAAADAAKVWSSGTTLPGAVKIVLTLEDEEERTYQFETVVYLPNS